MYSSEDLSTSKQHLCESVSSVVDLNAPNQVITNQ